MRAVAVVFFCVVVALACALSPPLAAQEGADPVSAVEKAGDRHLAWVWAGVGLTDVTGDVDAPGSLNEFGAEWRPWRLLGLAVVVGSGGIEEVGTCERDGFTVECSKFESIYSAALGTRIYVYQNAILSAFGSAQVGVQGNGLGRFRELGVGILFNTVGRLAVGIETRRRSGWPDHRADGALYVFRVGLGLGGAGPSEPESR